MIVHIKADDFVTIGTPYAVNINFRNVKSGIMDTKTEQAYLASDSNPSRISKVNLKQFQELGTSLIVSRLWIKNCEICSGGYLYCSGLKGSEINGNPIEGLGQLTRIPLNLFSQENFQPQDPDTNGGVYMLTYSPQPIKNQTQTSKETKASMETNINTKSNTKKSKQDKKRSDEDSRIERIDLPFSGEGPSTLISDRTKLYFLGGGSSFQLYIVDKEHFHILKNVTLEGIPPSTHFNMFETLGTLFVITMDSKSNSVLYMINENYKVERSFEFGYEITNLVLRSGIDSLLPNQTTMYFTSTSNTVAENNNYEVSSLVPFTLVPFFSDGQPLELALPPGMGIGCSLIDRFQNYAYIITSGQLISVIKADLNKGIIENSYNLHSGGNVSTCWIDHENHYMYFSQNVVDDSSSILKFNLNSFVPEKIMQLHNKNVQYIISGTLENYEEGVKLYLASEVDNPAQVVEIVAGPIDSHTPLAQSNFAALTHPNVNGWNPGGIKSQMVLGGPNRKYGFIARASDPSEISQIFIEDFSIVSKRVLNRTQEELNIRRIVFAKGLAEDLIVYGTASTPSYVAIYNTTSEEIIRSLKVDDERLGLVSSFDSTKEHIYVTTDVTVATLIKIELSTLTIIDRQNISSYFTNSAINEHTNTLYLTTAGRCVYQLDMNLPVIKLSLFVNWNHAKGYPLSISHNPYTNRIIIVYESLTDNEYFILEFNVHGITTRSRHFTASGMIRTSLFAEDQRLFLITYGAYSNIIVFDSRASPFSWATFIFYQIFVAIFAIVFLASFVGLIWYSNIKRRLDMKLRAEREMKRKLLEQNILDYGSISIVDDVDDFTYMIDLEALKFENTVSEGAFGVVYRGKWHNTEVAIKKIKRMPTDEREFTREVNHMASLRHPNVVQFLGICITSEHRFIVTEYIGGGSLDVWIFASSSKKKKNKRLSLSRKISILLDIALGMEYLHTLPQPLIHRDLKPQNVLVDEKGCAKVCDFGLSASMDASATMTGNVGTLQYMSPELMNNQKYDFKTDVYSFGILMWEVIFEKRAFCISNGPFMLGMSVLKGERPPIPKQFPSSQICDFAQLMQRCWQHEPTVRPTFHNIIDDLKQILASLKK